jgi:hypothetical protein
LVGEITEYVADDGIGRDMVGLAIPVVQYVEALLARAPIQLIHARAEFQGQTSAAPGMRLHVLA